MYRGNNPTAIQSQKMISESLVELIYKRDYSKINIKQICENARISRQTFYSLFHSKNEAIEYTLQIKLNDFRESRVPLETLSVSLLINYFTEWVFLNKAFLQLIIKNDLSNIFADFLKRTIVNHRKMADFSPHNATKIIDKYQLAYISGAIS